jgi:hypothetical protein
MRKKNVNIRTIHIYINSLISNLPVLMINAHTPKIFSLGPGVLLEMTGHQIQDGGRDGHTGHRSAPIFERDRPLLVTNAHTKNLFTGSRRSRNDRKPNSRWRPYWISQRAHFQKEPSSTGD